MKVNIGLTVDPEKATDSGIGAGVDSFFEYLVKGYVLLNDETLLEIWRQLEIPIEKYHFEFTKNMKSRDLNRF